MGHSYTPLEALKLEWIHNVDMETVPTMFPFETLVHIQGAKVRAAGASAHTGYNIVCTYERQDHGLANDEPP